MTYQGNNSDITKKFATMQQSQEGREQLARMERSLLQNAGSANDPVNAETQRQIDFWKLKYAECRDKYLALLEEHAVKNHHLKIKFEEHDCCAEDLLALKTAANALLNQIDIGDFVDRSE